MAERDRRAPDLMGAQGDEDFVDCHWSGLELSQAVLRDRSFQGCVFREIVGVELDLSASTLEDCEFVDCELNRMRVKGTRLHGVKFTRCKLMGIEWGAAGGILFDAHYEGCNLSYATFVGLRMRGCKLRNCRAHEALFADADLTKANFAGTDLARARFLNSVLVDADLSSAENFGVAPEENKLKRTKVSLQTALSLCERLGIVVDLSAPAPTGS